MVNEKLYNDIVATITSASDFVDFLEELENAKIGHALQEIAVIDDLIDAVKNLGKDKGEIVHLIRVLVVVCEYIQGKGQGVHKKKEAKLIFSRILDITEVSQRDRKTYMAIFDNSVELIFWGRSWIAQGGVSKLKSLLHTRIFCCA